MTFKEFCEYNGVHDGKQFVMLDKCAFPDRTITIDFTFIMFVEKGCADLLIDSEPKHIGRQYMSVIRAGHSIGCLSISEDIRARILLVGGDLEKVLSISDVFLTMFVLDETPAIRVSNTYKASARLFFEALSRVALFKDNPYQEECLLSLMRAFFYSTGYYLYEAFDFSARGKELQDISVRLKAFSEDSIIRQFIRLVEKKCRHHRLLSYYAGQLGYHPKYLSTLIKRQTGHTGQSIIDQYAVLTIKAKLSLSDRSIKEISNELDFPSQSDFGKYFKRITGLSPTEYRKQFLSKQFPDMARKMHI